MFTDSTDSCLRKRAMFISRTLFMSVYIDRVTSTKGSIGEYSSQAVRRGIWTVKRCPFNCDGVVWLLYGLHAYVVIICFDNIAEETRRHFTNHHGADRCVGNGKHCTTCATCTDVLLPRKKSFRVDPISGDSVKNFVAAAASAKNVNNHDHVTTIVLFNNDK